MSSPDLGLVELARGFRSGELRLDRYFDRMEAYFDQREPAICAFVPEPSRFRRLRGEAAALAERWPDPGNRPPLFGIPIGVKDIFQVSGFATRAGSQLPVEELQGPESLCVTDLKRAGALVLGKTATTEFAYFGPGPTRNPHNLDHTPGGSSSGSAAAVGAGICPLALGTQTIGSVVRPASFCGCVGFKPTYDRIPRAGVIPLSPSFDHIGLFAVDVAGIELAAGTVCARWGTGKRAAARPILGIPRGPYLERASPEMLAHFQRLCLLLEKAGYQLLAVDVMPDFAEIRERHYLVTAAEAARVHRSWFPKYRDRYHPKTVELLERGQSISDDTLSDALEARDRFSLAIRAAMDQAGIDLWLSPSAVGSAPRGLESTGDPAMNLPWTQAGLPALNLPSGLGVDGLPVGLQLTGKPNQDEAVLGWAGDMERLLRVGDSE